MAMSEMENKSPWGPHTSKCSHSTSYYNIQCLMFQCFGVFRVKHKLKGLDCFLILGCLIFVKVVFECYWNASVGSMIQTCISSLPKFTPTMLATYS
jgi:hypothetical protein